MFIDSKKEKESYEYRIEEEISYLLKTVSRLEEPDPDQKQQEDEAESF